MRSRRIFVRHARNTQPVVWIIDSEQWPRACLRAELIERGYDAHGFITIGDALDSLLQRTSSKPESIIVELRGQNLTKQLIDDIRELQVPTIVLGGNVELNESVVREQKWESVLKRPISLGKIADVVQTMLLRRL